MSAGIPFVPLDCQLDEKFDYIEAEFGLVGFAVVVKLFQRIYGAHGYYCEWNDRVALLFAHRLGVGGSAVREIVAACIREGLFDKGMYEQFGVLTSHGIQKRFYNVAKRRRTVFDKPEYTLPCCDNFSDYADNSGENAYSQDENVCNETTSKVSKLNESNYKQSKAENPPTPEKRCVRDELVKQYGEAQVAVYEERFDIWKSGKSCVGVEKYAAIAKWMAEDCVRTLSEKRARSGIPVSDEDEEIMMIYGGGLNQTE